MLRNTIPLVLVLCIFGCETVEKVAETQSGKPELIFETGDISIIKGEIISDMLNHGYTISKDTEYMLEMVRPATGAENLSASLSIGNSYSENSRAAVFNFARIGETVKVVVGVELRAQMPGGQLNKSDLHGNARIFNEYQKTLTGIRDKLDKL